MVMTFRRGDQVIIFKYEVYNVLMMSPISMELEPIYVVLPPRG